MKPDVERTAAFLRLLHEFHKVERVTHASDFSRKENDVEHSYFLAMLCWYLADSLQLDYSREKILTYALAHDLPETYAGDTYIFDTDGRETKEAREEEARIRIKGEFSEFEGLHAAISAYEDRSDPEAIFVHAIDKILPFLITYIQDGHTWKEMQMAHEELFAYKRKKIGEQPEARALLEQIIALIGDDWEKYFLA